MKNKRTFKEFQKELYIKKSYEDSPNSFVLPQSRYIDLAGNIKEEMPAVSWSKTNIIHGKDSSTVSSLETRQKLLGSLEVLKNKIESFEDRAFNVHKSYINSFLSLEDKFKKLEDDANRNILLYLKKDPFSYGFTENFSDLSSIDFERSDIEVVQNKVGLGIDSYDQKPLSVKNIRRRIYSKNGSIQNINQLSAERNILYKDGSYYKVKVESGSSNTTVELELKIELSEPTEIDKLCVFAKSINKNTEESITVFISKDDTNYKSVSFEALDTNGNLFEINETEIKFIKVSIQKFGADQSTNLLNEYLFSIDYIGLVNQTYKQESTLYLKPVEIKDEDDKSIDFNLATLQVGTCCIEPEGSSISFFVSKDNQTYYPAPYFEDSNSVVEFKNVINTNYFQKQENSENEFVMSSSGEYLLNNYIPAHLNLNLDKIIIKRGIGKWGVEEDYFVTNIEIKNTEGRYFNLGNSSCVVNSSERSGLIFLTKGIYEIKVSKKNYKEIKQKIKNSNLLKEEDELYPYNHKYIFEGYSYPIDFAGEKIYSSVDSLWKKTLKKVNSESLLTSTTYIILSNGSGTYFKVTNPRGEEFFIGYELAAESSSNKLYVKAVLRTENIYKSPRIDTIQARVI